MSDTRFPLRVLVTDPSEIFQLRFADQGAALLAGVSGIETQSSARGLIVSGIAERELSAAVAILRVAIPAAAVGTVEVVYLDQGSTEPWVRVRVTTPADHYGDVIAQLVQRRLPKVSRLLTTNLLAIDQFRTKRRIRRERRRQEHEDLKPYASKPR
jgi:hypothetical protein